MKNDSFIKVLLIIITTLLALNLMMLIFSNPEISYAAKNVEYKIVLAKDMSSLKDPPPIDRFLNELGKEGWELILIENGVMFFKR